jgi:hypothetical protein
LKLRIKLVPFRTVAAAAAAVAAAVDNTFGAASTTAAERIQFHQIHNKFWMHRQSSTWIFTIVIGPILTSAQARNDRIVARLTI